MIKYISLMVTMILIHVSMMYVLELYPDWRGVGVIAYMAIPGFVVAMLLPVFNIIFGDRNE